MNVTSRRMKNERMNERVYEWMSEGKRFIKNEFQRIKSKLTLSWWKCVINHFWKEYLSPTRAPHPYKAIKMVSTHMLYFMMNAIQFTFFIVSLSPSSTTSEICMNMLKKKKKEKLSDRKAEQREKKIPKIFHEQTRTQFQHHISSNSFFLS